MAQLSDRQQKKFAILRVISALGERIGQELRAAANMRLTSLELQAVAIIDQHSGLTQSEFAVRVHRTAVQVSRMIDELEVSGLVMRQQHKFDRRSKGLVLTDEGQMLCDRIKARAVLLASEVFGATSDDELELLVRHASRLAERIDLSLSEMQPGL